MSENVGMAEPLEQTMVRPKRRHKKEEETQTRRKKQPPYALIVENDDHHTFQYVIEVLQRVCGHTLEKATLLTLEVHETGRALVWSGTLELAELKRDQIRGFGPDNYATKTVKFPLGVTIEPLPE